MLEIAASKVSSVREDHRVRVAREKRERMHARLLRSVMAVCSGNPATGVKVIDDVVENSGASRGTFYKHFNSLEEAVSELGATLAEEMTRDVLHFFDGLSDPRERTATAFQIFVRRALVDPHWGGFIAHIGLLEPANLMIVNMSQDIQSGMDAGLYDLSCVEHGLDLLVGVKLEAIRRVVRGGRDDTYAQAMASSVLRGFGRPADESAVIVSNMAGRIETLAPDRLDWWPRAEMTIEP